ncbi:hypothetical protein [Gimesia sp.]|uniref:hypothetical protein n=1 Tax=Gimesia sp. TaxID=2024833 RepID=UPI0025C4B1E2|nr:hypothetical protein [Gimesia sp.]
MYGLAEMKSEFLMTETQVECPILGCDTIVRRRRNGDGDLRSDDFFCQRCGIFISSSTFEYKNETDNMLWNDAEDTALLTALKASKAEINRLSRERSEDAVSWNVFRYFQRMGKVCEMLSHLDPKNEANNAETIYWSFSSNTKTPWQQLLNARVAFGEAADVAAAATGKQVSEPDIIFVTDKSIVFVEAKFGSGNATSGDSDDVDRRVQNPKKYVTGADCWYDVVFESNYEKVVRDRKYELMRFWLLGSWIAKELDREFVLVNLVRNKSEQNIERDFGKHIWQTNNRHFVRWTWESLGPLLGIFDDDEARHLYEYLVQKTIGFSESKDRKLASPNKAFSMLEREVR